MARKTAGARCGQRIVEILYQHATGAVAFKNSSAYRRI